MADRAAPVQEALLAGVNLPVLGGHYNHDLAPNERYPQWGCDFTPLEAYRYLAVCRDIGFGAARVWLCEDGEGLRTDGRGRVEGVMPRLLDAVRTIQDGARILGLRVYFTLLDANSWQRNGDRLTGAIASDPDQTSRFADRVAAPIAEALDPEVAFALEVLNEPESLSCEVVERGGLPWQRIADAIRTIRSSVHAARPGIPVTSGTQAVFLKGLLRDLAEGRDAPVDAVDLHVYHPDGGLPSRADLPIDVGDLAIWAGECGLSHRAAHGHSHYLTHYLYNARALGYRAAFLWQLEGAEHLGAFEREPPDGPRRFRLTQLGKEVRELLRKTWAGGR